MADSAAPRNFPGRTFRRFCWNMGFGFRMTKPYAWFCAPATLWRPAGCLTIWGVVLPAIPWMPNGVGRISRRCSMTTPSWLGLEYRLQPARLPTNLSPRERSTSHRLKPGLQTNCAARAGLHQARNFERLVAQVSNLRLPEVGHAVPAGQSQRAPRRGATTFIRFPTCCVADFQSADRPDFVKRAGWKPATQRSAAEPQPKIVAARDDFGRYW